ncbi:Pyrrolo-quinoline quinone beta-propeller repeat protein [Haloterrigena turkmenica DSM 5511]|uniref:Pyrrolo-quinoline quinone beta-propeller repeat protein n=1 Tax=Haloterrigena turkmenica (strain ATCC 51198 / DSM 5511 / JCM 9101 / NCIMB 13204 / VKM B-1734 / 4k) TaxID=543526 RepID=D2RPM8_HALTV|nr:PQQ-binding-like beta-propeller repeat protein [Haloterrigena turkmenica]ADB62180.1 Pyrrolo-quinoline quinone beta-propeller repeat protein [Haloterrigena turkmenica DSM 5511]
MEDWYRRSVLATGAALSVGGLTSIGAGSEDGDATDLPDPDIPPNPRMADEDWPSRSGDAGHARFVEDGYEFDGDLEVAWSVDQTDSVAVANDTVYTTTEDGVVALDAADGSLVWESTDADAYSPAVVGEMVYLSGDEIVALDREDGSVRWESDLGPEEWTSSHTVAYDSVFAVVDGTLYALEADDGSVRWQKDSVSIEMDDGEERAYDFVTGTAAANGVVYVGTEGGPLAFDPATGDEVWRGTPWSNIVATRTGIQATTTAVLVNTTWNPEYLHYDAQTGERLYPVVAHNAPALSDESTIAGDDHGYGSQSIRDGEGDWKLDVTYTYGYRPVISGETVYVYFVTDGHNYGDRDYDRKLVALDKRDGSEKWALSRDDAPVGHVRAISGETIYVDHDGELVALRERAGDEDATDEGDENGADEREGEGSGDSDGGDAGESGDANGDEDAPEDTGEDADGDAGTEDDADDSSGDSDDDDNSPGEAGGDGTADDGNGDGDDPTENATTDAEDDGTGDGVPGFTTGTGLVGGGLGLEWLRRRVDADEPAE